MNGENTSIDNFPIGDKPSKGPVVGTIIIVLIIIIGGIYIITSRPSNPAGTVPADQSGESPRDPAVSTGIVPTGSTGDQAALSGLDSVQADLNASEADLQALETEIQ